MTAATVVDPNTTTERISLAFSTDATLAACLAADGPGPYTVETWAFTADGMRTHRLPTPEGETMFTQILPVADRQALMVRHTDDSHQLWALRAMADGIRLQELEVVAAEGFRLLAGPTGTILTVTTEADGRSRIGELERDGTRPRPLAVVDGRVIGGAALDPYGRSHGFTCHDDRGAHVVRLDRRSGEVARVALGGEHRSYLLAADHLSGRALVAVDSVDGLRAGYVTQLGSATPSFPASLADFPETAQPLALSPGGDLSAFLVRRGATSRVYLHHAPTDRLTEVDTPDGVFTGSAGWSTTGLRLDYRSPVCPSGVLTVVGDARGSSVRPMPAGQWLPARLETFPGAAGPVEAVVYGDWRTAQQVVVALHGGPDSAWEMDFQPLFQRFAAAGLAIVAPNQRGSTGYDTAYANAIRGAWGGPDGDDIAALGQALLDGRRPGARRARLFGQSYGAYLALRVAARTPALWSGCATVAGFLSPETLWADAGPRTRSLIERLDGRTPRDGCGELFGRSAPLAIPLLVMHGAGDETIPVEHARRLRRHLWSLPRAAGIDLEFHEIAAAGHDPLSDPGCIEAVDALIAFLSEG